MSWRIYDTVDILSTDKKWDECVASTKTLILLRTLVKKTILKGVTFEKDIPKRLKDTILSVTYEICCNHQMEAHAVGKYCLPGCIQRAFRDFYFHNQYCIELCNEREENRVMYEIENFIKEKGDDEYSDMRKEESTNILICYHDHRNSSESEYDSD